MGQIGKRQEGVVEQPDNRPSEQVNGCPQFSINECEKHCNSTLDTVTLRVNTGKLEKLTFLIDTGAEISIVRSASLGLNLIMNLLRALM